MGFIVDNVLDIFCQLDNLACQQSDIGVISLSKITERRRKCDNSLKPLRCCG